MRVVRVGEPIKSGGTIRLHHLTDLHVGAPDFAEPEFRARVSLIADDPGARWTMGGDAGDLIRHSDKRYSPTELHERYRLATDLVLATQEHLVELLAPIASKCWGWADGNHERTVDRAYGGHFGAEITTMLGIQGRFVGYRGFVEVRFAINTVRLPLLIDLQHGWQAGRLKGAPLVQAERELGTSTADVVLRGHNHQPLGHPFVTLDLTGGGKGSVVRRHRSVINGGTWRLGYRDDLAPINPRKLSEVEGDLWSETKGFRAEPLGGPVLALRVVKGDGAPSGIEHSIISGEINARTLGLAQ